MEGNIVEINPKEKYISMEVTNVVFGYGKSKVKSGDIIYFDFSQGVKNQLEEEATDDEIIEQFKLYTVGQWMDYSYIEEQVDEKGYIMPYRLNNF